MKPRHVASFFAVVASLFSSHIAYASSISLSFNSLPSAQGWTYFSGPAAESSVFSVNGTGLFLDSLGQGNTEPLYVLPGVVNTTDPFVYSETAAVFADEGSLPLSFYFEVRTATPNEEAVIGITPSEVLENTPNGAGSLAVNGTGFNTYTLFGTPDGSFNLSVNGTPAFSGSFAFEGGAVDGIEFGDAEPANSNSSGEITCLSFVQSPTTTLADAGCSTPTSAVPEPGTLGLLSGVIILGTASGFCRKILFRQ